ncbi:MAG: alpha-galactosidase [Spirochaetales bacterium]|nr:alpha-galactosidase [Spirochaetales bacterium]
MNTVSNTTEVWMELCYRYKGESYQYNLPLSSGSKFLDGLKIDYEKSSIHQGFRYQLHLVPLGTVLLDRLVLTGPLNYGDDLRSVFVNGYQSWTTSRERFPGERIAKLNWPGRLLGLQSLGDYSFYSYPEKKGRFHGFGYAYVRYPDRILLAGSLNEELGHTILATDLRHNMFSITKDVSHLELTSQGEALDLVLLEGDEHAVFSQFAQLRTSQSLQPTIASAWGGGEEEVGDEVSLRRQLSACRENQIPLDYFLIDRGWQARMGDWESPAAGFPSGMASLAAEIRGSGYKPGLWWAPFVVSPESLIFREHRDMIARDLRNRIRPVLFHPRYGGALFALDLNHPDLPGMLKRSMERFREDWGYEFLRSDLLFAASLRPPSGQSRGGAMAQATKLLESLKGPAVHHMGALPLDAAFGRSDFCRVTANPSSRWERPLLRSLHARERSTVRNSIRTGIGRWQLNERFFLNDTGPFSLIGGRGENREASFFLTALFSRLISTCDEVSDYSQETLQRFQSLFPLAAPQIQNVETLRRVILVHYVVNQRQYFAAVNLADRTRTFFLPEGRWFQNATWDTPSMFREGGGKHVLKPGEMQNHLFLQPTDPLAGGEGHVFPGAQVASIQKNGNSWEVELLPNSSSQTRIWLNDDGAKSTLINGQTPKTQKTPWGETVLLIDHFPNGSTSD